VWNEERPHSVLIPLVGWLTNHAGIPYILHMRTVVELPTFQKQAACLWSNDEREAFIDWIAANPDAGVVIPGAQGVRKVRWARSGAGKSGGVRVIYFNQTKLQQVWLLAIYAKADRDNMAVAEIRRML